jgi:hypothetical protein
MFIRSTTGLILAGLNLFSAGFARCPLAKKVPGHLTMQKKNFSLVGKTLLAGKQAK